MVTDEASMAIAPRVTKRLLRCESGRAMVTFPVTLDFTSKTIVIGPLWQFASIFKSPTYVPAFTRS